MKKYLSIGITVMFAVILLLFCTVSVGAEREGDFHYTVSNGEATITGCESDGAVEIPSTLGGYPVTAIDAFAFNGCTGLTSVTIPNSVTTIGYYAFEGCTGLTSVTIPNSVTTIGYYAFEGCTGLTSVTIPDSVTTIGNAAFNGCTSLTSVTIPDGVTTIGNSAFNDCTSLTSVDIPDSVTTIGYYAFSGCTSLTSVDIPDSITEISPCAFWGCTGLTSVTIPNSVIGIMNYAFSNCTGLTSVTIPDSVTTIGYSAFSNCTSLTSVTIPDSVTHISADAFAGTKLYDTESNWEDGVLYIDNCLIKAETTITSCEIKEATRLIASESFYNCTDLTAVSIPNSVTSICSFAFSDCTGLTSVAIPNSVTTIDNHTFYNCTGLTSVAIPDSVTIIDTYAFYSCTGLTSIAIPESVVGIGSSAFRNCTGLTSVAIPDSVTFIDDLAFAGCTDLTSIAIPESITTIGWGMFDNCTNLKYVCYLGTQQQAETVSIEDSNECLTAAQWHYNCCVTNHIYDDFADTVCNICEHPREVLMNSSERFIDVPAEMWYKPYVDYVATYGILNGTGTDTFSPDVKMSRAQFVQMLANLSGVDTSNKNVTTVFNDVHAGDWYAPAVKWANENNLAGGNNLGGFAPNDDITREQMCLLMVRYIENYMNESVEPVNEKKTFSDDGEISSWAKDAVYKCQQAGLVNGVSATEFAPNQSLDRASASTLITRFHQNFMK